MVGRKSNRTPNGSRQERHESIYLDVKEAYGLKSRVMVHL